MSPADRKNVATAVGVAAFGTESCALIVTFVGVAQLAVEGGWHDKGRLATIGGAVAVGIAARVADRLVSRWSEEAGCRTQRGFEMVMPDDPTRHP